MANFFQAQKVFKRFAKARVHERAFLNLELFSFSLKVSHFEAFRYYIRRTDCAIN